MTGPVTHLLWGYVLTRCITPNPGYQLLGMSAAVLLDAGALLPGVEHHGWLHTPVFILFVALTLWGASRDRMLFMVPALAMGSHLALDSVGAGIMWGWPLSEQALVLVPVGSGAGLATAHMFLLLVPLYGIWDRWKATGESPLDAFRWAAELLPRPVAWGGVSTFALLTVLVMGQRYLLALVG
jgi:hypothetical protein